MCERCDEIDRQMKRYRSSRSTTTDPLAIEWLGIVIDDFQSEKAALHPDRARSPD